MKTLIAAAMLLALASPAFAADDGSSLWDCPHGVTVTMQADGTFSANPPTKRKIGLVGDFEAPSPGDYVVQLGGKDCKYRRPEWYLTVAIYTHDDHGELYDPVKMHLKHAFNSRNECLERARTFSKQCRGLIADQRVRGVGVTKFPGYCQRHRQQPEPVLVAPEGDDKWAKQEQECAE